MWLVVLQIFLLLLWNSASELMIRDKKKIVCFYGGWSSKRSGSEMSSPREVDAELCTHLVYAYAGLDDDDRITPLDSYADKERGSYIKFSSLKSFNKNLKTLLAVGKGLSRRLSAIAADEGRRHRFAKNVIMFLRVNRFNGINLSWQYPGPRYGGVDDKTNFVLLVKTLREEFEQESTKTGRETLLMALDVPHSVKLLKDGYDLPSLSKYLDFMNVFTFNYRIPVEAEMRNHAPLFQQPGSDDESQFTVDYTVRYYLKMGVQREKIILGVPTYGRSLVLHEPDGMHSDASNGSPGMEENFAIHGGELFEGSLPYHEICNMLKSGGWRIERPSPQTSGPYAHLANYFVGYDDTASVTLKAEYAAREGLGGLMFWTINSDDFQGDCHGKRFPLIQAGKEVLWTTDVLSNEAHINNQNRGKDDKVKLLFSYMTQNQYASESSINNVQVIHDDMGVYFDRNGKDRIQGDIFKRMTESNGLEKLRESARAGCKSFSQDDQCILNDLISYIKNIGGVEGLKLLVSNPARSSEESRTSTSQVRAFSADYGAEVASLTVTSPPLYFKKPEPIVLTNFTINIERLDIIANPQKSP